MIDGSLESLVNLTHLATLNVSMNALMGTLPDFLFTHRSLTDIDLEDNHFSGSISYSLGKSDQLRVFWARNNSLTGTIPSAVGQSWVLGSLSLSSNELVGTIPDFVPSSRIWGLHLAQTKLTGTIPTTIGSLSSLEYFDLTPQYYQMLRMSGPIPSEIGKCHNLVRLTLSNNTLSGTIPSEFGALTSLEYLQLWNNLLSGFIPAELSQCTDLVIADFAENELTGSIPSSLSRLTNLDYLHFDGNDLTGGLDAFCGIDFEIFSANLCTEPDKVECACCTHCCMPDSLTCSPL
jgi:Leucine-rich repeat (LRR) protein